MMQSRQLSGGVSEYSFPVIEHLRNGLSPDARMPRNSPYAETLLNLQATQYGAVTPDAITNPISGGPTPNWGTAGTVQMFRGERNRWVMGQTQGYSASASWAATSVGATFTAGGPWQAVFFQEIPFFSNGTVFLWGTSLLRTTALTVQGLGKHQNRLLLGGVAGSILAGTVFQRVFQQWKNTATGDRLAYAAQAFDTGWVLYGERGGGSSDRPFDALLSLLGLYTTGQIGESTNNQADLEAHLLTQLEEYQWGMGPLRYPGAVMAFHELADAPLAFGAGGVARLRQDGDIYFDDRIHAIGIGGRGCVGGDLLECVFIDAAREIWRIVPGSVPQRLNYAHHLGGLTLANTTIAYDPAEKTYWIADKASGFILDMSGSAPTLSGPMQVFPTSLVREGGALLGVTRDVRVDPTKTPVLFRSMPLDVNERGTKHLTTLQVGQEGVGLLTGGMDYRYDDSASSYDTGIYTQATPASAIFPYPRVSFVDGKVVVSGEVPNGEEGQIERIEVRYQAEDITFRRGTKFLVGANQEREGGE
jgi:hypothetical protein